MNFRTFKSTFWYPFGVYWKASKRVSSQILGWGFKSKQIQKRCSPIAADRHLSLSGSNFPTARNLSLQEVLPENRHLGISPNFGMNPFGQVFWKICLFKVDAVVLKSADSFLLLLLYLLTFWSPPLFHLAGCFGRVFHWFLLNAKAYISGENLNL